MLHFYLQDIVAAFLVTHYYLHHVQVVMLNEAYSRVEYRLDKEGFDSVPALVRYYVGNRKPVSQVGKTFACCWSWGLLG